MKTNRNLILLFIVVAAQLLWLACNYYSRLHELETAPTLHIQCDQHDPRDLLRGDFISLNTSQSVPLEALGSSLYWGDPLCSQLNNHEQRDDDGVWRMQSVSNPLSPRITHAADAAEIRDQHDTLRVAAFWKKGEDGYHHIVRVEHPGSSADSPAPGEFRCLMWGGMRNSISSCRVGKEPPVHHRQTHFRLSFFHKSWHNIRYYVQEKTGDIERIWTEELNKAYSDFPTSHIRYTVDLALRPSAAPIPRMLYLNGIPYPQAVQQIRNKTFPWQAEQNEQTK